MPEFYVDGSVDEHRVKYVKRFDYLILEVGIEQNGQFGQRLAGIDAAGQETVIFEPDFTAGSIASTKPSL